MVATLGTGDDEQMIDALGRQHIEKFMLHYNFLALLGWEKRAAWARRAAGEVGHGKLA